MFNTDGFPAVPVNILSQASYKALDGQFIHDQVFPTASVPTAIGTIYTEDLSWDQLNLKPTRSYDVAPLVQTAITGVNYSMHTIRRRYFVDPDKLENLPDWVRANDIQTGVNATVRNVRIAFEYWASRTVFNPANWQSGFTPIDAWNTPDAKPLTDLKKLCYDVGMLGQVGINTIIMDRQSEFYFTESAEVQNLFRNLQIPIAGDGNMQRGITTGDLKGLVNFWTPGSSFTSSNEGQPQSSIVRVPTWFNGVWVGYIDPNPQGDTYASATVGVAIKGKENLKTRTYNDPNLDEDSEFVESKKKRGFAIPDPKLGGFINNPLDQ